MSFAAAAAAARDCLIRLQSIVTSWEHPTPRHHQLTIDPGWDKPGDLDTSAGSDQTPHSALESLGRIVWAKGFFLILVFICWVTEVKLSLFDYLKLLAVEIICALAAVRWVVCSSESVAGSKEVILHSTLKPKIEHTGQKALHGTMQKLLSARRNPLIFWRWGGWVSSRVLLNSPTSHGSTHGERASRANTQWSLNSCIATSVSLCFHKSRLITSSIA